VLARFSLVWFRGPFRWTTNCTGGLVWFRFRLHNHWFGLCSNWFKPVQTRELWDYYYYFNYL